MSLYNILNIIQMIICIYILNSLQYLQYANYLKSPADLLLENESHDIKTRDMDELNDILIKYHELITHKIKVDAELTALMNMYNDRQECDYTCLICLETIDVNLLYCKLARFTWFSIENI
jgi:hypothetical protein